MRYKLTLAALAVEGVMLSFLIANGVHLTTRSLQQQAEQRVEEIAQTLGAALLAPLMQQDDASVRDIVETLQHDGGLKMIEVRDRSDRTVYQAGGGEATDFHRVQPIGLAGQRYGEVGLVLSGEFI
ncbi:MAG: sensor domain-containing diguanylate cyclase, partial [Betaproteobacteria bacterium HGW-Betaproteobacteria-17]